jgi:hypothetical protein
MVKIIFERIEQDSASKGSFIKVKLYIYHKTMDKNLSAKLPYPRSVGLITEITHKFLGKQYFASFSYSAEHEICMEYNIPESKVRSFLNKIQKNKRYNIDRVEYFHTKEIDLTFIGLVKEQLSIWLHTELDDYYVRRLITLGQLKTMLYASYTMLFFVYAIISILIIIFYSYKNINIYWLIIFNIYTVIILIINILIFNKKYCTLIKYILYSYLIILPIMLFFAGASYVGIILYSLGYIIGRTYHLHYRYINLINQIKTSKSKILSNILVTDTNEGLSTIKISFQFKDKTLVFDDLDIMQSIVSEDYYDDHEIDFTTLKAELIYYVSCTDVHNFINKTITNLVTLSQIDTEIQIDNGNKILIRSNLHKQ